MIKETFCKLSMVVRSNPGTEARDYHKFKAYPEPHSEF